MLAVALAWRLAFWHAVDQGPLVRMHEWSESDMATFLAQADRMAAGDWLMREPLYPHHGWMQQVPAREWARWHARPMAYQPPLYSYGIAGLRATGVPVVGALRWLQLGLGVAACGLTYIMTWRLLGRAAGAAAGLLLAIYGPLIMTEGQVLRDGPMLALTLLVLWLATDALRRFRLRLLTYREWLWRAAVLGAVLGIDAMLHEGAVVLAGAIALFGAATTVGRFGRLAAARWTAVLTLGVVAGYAPMLVRGLVIDAPLGPRYFGSALAFVTANHPDVPQVTADRVFGNALPDRPERFAAMMRRAQGSVPALVVGVARDYGSGWSEWPARWGRRLLALAIGSESNENLSYSYFRARVPVLRLSADFRWLAPLACAGALLLTMRRRRARLCGPLGLVVLQGALVIGMVSLVHPFGRYRLMFLPAMAPLAGLALASLWSAGRRGHWRKAMPSALAVAAVVLVQAGIERTSPYDRLSGLRAAEYVGAANVYLGDDDPAAAIAILREGLAVLPEDRGLRSSLAFVQAVQSHRANDWEAAVRHYEEALEINPDHALAPQYAAAARQHWPLVSRPAER